MYIDGNKKFPSRETPFFILGNNRSGTSLLRLMLTCHEQIVIPPESHFLLWNYDKYRFWQPENGYENFLLDLFNSTKFETWELNKQEIENFLNFRKPLSYSELCADIYIFFALKQKKGASVWGDKNSLWVEKLPILYSLYNQAKFIHIVRDGRDVAVSYIDINQYPGPRSKYFPKLPYQIEQIAKLWNNNVLSVSRFLSQISHHNYIEIKYEDLVCESEIAINTVLNFLNLRPSPAIFTYYEINKSKHFEPEEFLSWKAKLNEPLDRSNIGKYKYRLAPSDIKIFEQIAAEALERYGYLKNG